MEDNCILETADILYMSKEDLQVKYLLLNKAYTKIQQECEQKSQEIYDCKRELTRKSALESEYICEIESLQSKENKECEKLKLRIQNFEDERSRMERLHEEHIERLEQCLNKKDENINKLQDELTLLVNISDSKNDKHEVDDLQSQICELKNIRIELSNEIETSNQQIMVLEKEKLICEEQYHALEHDYEIMSEKYYAKDFELIEAGTSIETLQEDLILLRNELDAAKSKPLNDGSQGNSLFAEVDDKRLEIQKNMVSMKTRYLKMQQEQSKLLSQIATLNCSNSMLCQRWETEVKDKEVDYDKIEDSYKDRIKYLESQVEAYKNEISTRQKICANNLESGEIEFMENMLAAKNKEIETLKKTSDHFSLSKMILSRDLMKSNMELRQWRAKATQLDFDVAKLKVDIEQMKLKPSETNSHLKLSYCENCSKNRLSETRPTLKEISKSFAVSPWTLLEERKFSMVDCSRQIKRSLLKEPTQSETKDMPNDIPVENKENRKITENTETSTKNEKRVQFTEETVDNSNTKNKISKAGKVIISKPMILKRKY